MNTSRQVAIRIAVLAVLVLIVIVAAVGWKSGFNYITLPSFNTASKVDNPAVVSTTGGTTTIIIDAKTLKPAFDEASKPLVAKQTELEKNLSIFIEQSTKNDKARDERLTTVEKNLGDIPALSGKIDALSKEIGELKTRKIEVKLDSTGLIEELRKANQPATVIVTPPAPPAEVPIIVPAPTTELVLPPPVPEEGPVAVVTTDDDVLPEAVPLPERIVNPKDVVLADDVDNYGPPGVDEEQPVVAEDEPMQIAPRPARVASLTGPDGSQGQRVRKGKPHCPDGFQFTDRGICERFNAKALTSSQKATLASCERIETKVVKLSDGRKHLLQRCAH